MGKIRMFERPIKIYLILTLSLFCLSLSSMVLTVTGLLEDDLTVSLTVQGLLVLTPPIWYVTPRSLCATELVLARFLLATDVLLLNVNFQLLKLEIKLTCCTVTLFYWILSVLVPSILDTSDPEQIRTVGKSEVYCLRSCLYTWYRTINLDFQEDSIDISYVGALLYLAVHHLFSCDCLKVLAKVLDLSISSEIPNTGPDLRCMVMLEEEGWYLELGCSVTIVNIYTTYPSSWLGLALLKLLL